MSVRHEKASDKDRRQRVKHGKRLTDLEGQVRRVARNATNSGFGLELTHETFEGPSCTNCVKCWIGICCLIIYTALILLLLGIFNVI